MPEGEVKKKVSFEDIQNEDPYKALSRAEGSDDGSDFFAGKTHGVKTFSEGQMNEMNDKNINVLEQYQDRADLGKQLYDKQGAWETTKRVVGTGLAKGSLSVLENAGYMLDIPQIIGATDDFDEGYTNWLSEMASEGKKELDEYAPIYSEGFGDVGWMAQGAQSIIDSGLGFAIPGGVAGKAIGRGAKLVNQMVKAGKLSEHALAQGLTAFYTNYAESQMMAKELYKNVYDSAIEAGVDPEKAKETAASEGRQFLWQNKFNAATDFVALKGLLSGHSILSGGAQQTIKGTIKGGAKQMAAEAWEEGSSGFLQKDNERDAALKLGYEKDDDSDMLSRAVDYAGTDEGMTEMIMGALGGPGQHAGTKATGKIVSAVKQRAGFKEGPQGPGAFTAPEPTRADFNLAEDAVPEVKPDAKRTLDEFILAKHPEAKGDADKMSAYRKDFKVEHQNEVKDLDAKHKAFDAANKPWADLAEATTAWEKAKEDHAGLVAKNVVEQEEFEKDKNTGKIAKTKDEVAAFLKKEAVLIEQYKAAVLSDNPHEMENVQNERFENLFLRHAKHSSATEKSGGDGSLESQLKEVAQNPNSTEEEKSLANKYLGKMEKMNSDHTKIYDKHSNDNTVDVVWKAKVRMDNMNELLGTINEDGKTALTKLADDIQKLEGKSVSALDLELVRLRKEQVAIQAARKSVEGSVSPGGRVLSELDRKSKELGEDIEKVKVEAKEASELGEKNVDAKLIYAHEDMTAVEEIATNKAKAFTAYNAYKESYEFVSGQLGNKLKVQNAEFLNNQINEVETLEDASVAHGMIQNMALSKKERVALNKSIEAKRNALIKEAAIEQDSYDKAKAIHDDLKVSSQQLVSDERSYYGKVGVAEIKLNKLKRLQSQVHPSKRAKIVDGTLFNEFDEAISNAEMDLHSLQNARARVGLEKDKINEAWEDAKNTMNYKFDQGLSASKINYESYRTKVQNNNTPTAAELEEAAREAQRIADDERASKLKTHAAKISTSTPKVVTPPKKGEVIHSDDKENSEFEPAIPEKTSALQGVFQNAPNTVAYITTSDESGLHDGNHESAIHDWLEVETHVDKTGVKFELEVETSEFDDNMHKRKVRMYVLDADGNRMKYGDKFVFGYLRDGETNTAPFIVEGRKAVDAAIKAGTLNELRPAISLVRQGTLVSESGTLNDIREKMNVETGKDVTLAMTDGSFLWKGKGVPVLNDNGAQESGKGKTTGFVYAMIKDAAGKQFPLRLNSRKLEGVEVDVLYQLVKAITVDKLDHKSDVIGIPEIQGLSYKEAIDLMVFEGEGSLQGKFPFYMQYKGNTLHIGDNGKAIPFSSVEENEQRIKDFLATMWRTTRSDMINQPMENIVADDFKWFGEPQSILSTYNDFLMDTDALTTNAVFPNGRAFIQPGLQVTDPGTWGSKEIISTPAIKKAAVATTKIAKAIEVKPEEKKPVPAGDPTDNDTFVEPGVYTGNAFGKKKKGPEEGPKEEGKVFEGKGPFGKKAPVGNSPQDINDNQAEGKTKTKRVSKKREVKGTYTKDVFTPTPTEVNTDTKTAETTNVKPPLMSRFEKRKAVIDVDKEMANLHKILPNVPSTVHKGLIGITGGFAEGMFFNGVMTLSNVANVGTGYHEAFHAVTHLYLTPEQRTALYKDAESVYGELSDADMEEALAEGFREYMVGKDPVGTPKSVSWLYNLLQDIVNLFRSKDKALFAKIRAGRFDYAPTNELSKDILYRLPFQGDLNKEIVDGMVYLATSYSGVRSMDGDVTPSDIEDIFSQIYNDFDDAATAADEAGNDELVAHYENILLPEYFDAFKEIAMAEIESLGFAPKTLNLDVAEEEDYDEDDKGDLNIINALQASGKDNAPTNTKLMVAMLQDPNATSKYFGNTMPKLANFAETWKQIEMILPGIVASETTSAQVQMLDRLKEASEEYPPFKELVTQLESDNTPLYKKTQFYYTFSKQNVTYTMSLGQEVGKGVVEWVIGNADTQRQASVLKNKWAEAFHFTKVLEDDTVVAPNMARAIDSFEELLANPIEDMITTDEYLSQIFNDAGIDISPTTFKSFIATQKGTTESEKTLKALNELKWFFRGDWYTTKGGQSITAQSYVEGAKWDKEKNFITNNRVIGQLAAREAAFSKMPGDSMVLGPDGKTYWSKSLNNSLTKTLGQWKSNPMLIDEFLKATYHKNSKWLPIIRDQITNGTGDFNLEVFLFNQLKDGNDAGETMSEIGEIDETIDRINRTLGDRSSGAGSVFTPLTMADKSTLYQMSGIPMRNYKSKKGISKLAVLDFYNYAEAEIERISEVLRTDTNIKHYSKKGGLESFWFPELSKGGKVANELELYNDDGTVNLADNKSAIQAHVKEVLETRIEKDTAKLAELGILEANLDRDQLGIAESKIPRIKMTGVSKSIEVSYGIGNPDVSLSNAATTEMINDYLLNSMVANIEFTMLFSGDPAFYKDLAKRTAATIATGNDAMYLDDQADKVDRHFNIAVTNDIEGAAPLLKEYTESFKAIKGLNPASLNAYKKNNKADAQAYLRPSRFKDIMRMTGKWNDAIHNPMYNRLMGKGDVQAGDLNEMQDRIRKSGMPSGQPLKGMHFEIRQPEGSNLRIPTYLKYSQATLWPALVQGTRLEKVVAQMEAAGVDELIFESGVKTGAQDISPNADAFFNGTSEVLTLTPIKLDNFNWKLQQDLPAKYDKKGRALVGSQPKKNIIANLMGRTIQYKGEDISGEDFANKVHEVERVLSDMGREDLDTLWGIVDGNIKDNKVIFKEVAKKLRRDKASNNIIELLEEGVDMPLDGMFQYIEKLESELHSTVTANTVKLKSPGGAFIQMSNAGFEPVRALSKDKITNLNGIVHLKDVAELQGPRKDKDGNTVPGDVYLPYKAIENIEGLDEMLASGTLTGAEVSKRLGDTITGLVGYRIPNQGMSSIDTLNIAGILPAHMGDTIVTYTEITGKTGSDFDIDKMYVMMPHTTWSTQLRKMVKVPADTKTKEGAENLRIELWNSILMANDTYGDLVTPLDSEFLKEDAYYIAFLEELRSTKSNTKEHSALKLAAGIENAEAFMKLPAGERVKIANDYFGNKAPGALEFASPMYQLEVKSRNMAGKAGIGQTANHLTHHALAQGAGLYLKYNLGIGNQLDNGAIDLSQSMVKGKDMTITATISAWLNAYVDNAKDPYISLINNNSKTANTVFLMLRAGVDPEFVNRFMSQPLIKEYIEAEFAGESKNLKSPFMKYTTLQTDENGGLHKVTKEAPANALYKVLGDVEGLVIEPTDLSTLTVDQLEEQILLPKVKNEVSSEQAGLLFKFLEIQHNAEKLNDAVRASKADTKGAHGSAADNLAAREMKRKVETEGHVGNFDRLFDGMLGAFHENGTDYSDQIFSKMMLSKTPAVEATIRAINAMQGKGDFAITPKMSKKVMSAARSYMYSGATDITDHTKVANLFYGNNTMADNLFHMQEAFPDNIFLNTLSFTKDKKGGASFVTIAGSKKKDQTDNDRLWMEWERMLSDDTMVPGQAYKVSDFAKDLIKYSFHSSGFTKGISTFYDLIPNTYLRNSPMFQNHMNTFLKHAQHGGVMETFMEQFIRHNAADDMVVPGFTMSVAVDERGQKYETMGSLTKKGVRALGNVFTDGLAINAKTLPSKWVASGSDVNTIPVSYIKLKGLEDKLYLYRYAGHKNGEFYYEAIQTLGNTVKGNHIVEYQPTTNPETIAPTHKMEIKGLDIKTLSTLEYSAQDGSAMATDTSLGYMTEVNGVLKMDGLSGSFDVFQKEQDGQVYFSMRATVDGVVKEIGVFGETAEDARLLGETKLREMGKQRAERALKNKC